MKTTSFAGRLLGSTSLVVLSAAAILGTQPAAAQTTISNGIYGGGSTLSSLALRQLFDCYAGTTVANDGQTFSPAFTIAPPSPNLLPTSCTQFSTPVEGMFAAVGAGNGQRAYVANDPRQLFRGSPDSAPALVRKPSAKPPFRDSANANFKTYPYPRIDFATSDLPLADTVASLTTVSFSNFLPSTNWQNTLLIAALSKSSASFNAASVGAPIQVPAMEVPVAIAVNTSNSASGVTWTNQSALSPNSQAGGAIQLSTAQLCAIFSATVTDWHDASTMIPYLDANGTQQFQHFYDDNTNGTLTPVAYTSGRLPIKVVYRADDAGTSYILTNYLANLCPLLDPTGTYSYRKIFTGVGVDGSTRANLPSSRFSNLLANIKAVKATDQSDPYDVDDDAERPDPRWISASGSNHAALKIGTNPLLAGRIGYLSADYTQPYAQTVTEEIAGITISAAAPRSASIQNEALRIFGVYHPGQTDVTGTAQNFVAPTPDNVAQSFSGLSAPALGGSYNGWNIYAQRYADGTVLGGVDYSSLSVIGIPLVSTSDYALTGASYVNVYSCYSDAGSTRVPTLKNWMAWFYGGSVSALPAYNPAMSNANNPGFDPNVAQLIRNNGFHELDPTWASNVLGAYLRTSAAGGTPASIAAYNASGAQTDGCVGVTGGAK
ncbi:substrate-binding domain-containing protein [Bradyrhizobium tropiciagri]|uniref:substrate-binding domain-containing protein n=1 Tax=Bradyrhizobium tropiciagri TaxID=312253 RepID=UPI001BA5DDBB|nr:substrate-binding domain-containing protein [Bradyrhizobium tropiciagri]MBR0871348.1 substrate-binding domain-containing protein [Bradyrhizobium tropiciagri]